MSEVDPKAEIYRMDNKPESELRKLAIAMVEGTVFSTAHMREHDMAMMACVFMPFVFMDEVTHRAVTQDLGLVYESMSEAGPRAINGMPSFMSCKLLNTHDAKLLFDFMAEYREVKAKFTAEVPEHRLQAADL